MGTRDQTRLAARERLDRFATEWFVHEHPDFRNPYIGTLDGGNGLRQAAEVALAGVQRDLLAQATPLEPPHARELIRERFRAITALIYLDGPKGAKETLLRVTDGEPLTICMGDVCRVRTGAREPVATRAGNLPFSVKGCRAIFDEDRRTSGEMWAGLCPDCRRGKPRRDQGRALNRRVNAMMSGRGATTYAWSVKFEDG